MALGRPRGFDTDLALDQALQVFWRKGYAGTSLADLTAAMEINRPSLYAAFGNKESLFRAALARYVERAGKHYAAALVQPDVRDAVRALWNGGLDLIACPRGPKGCFLIQAALAGDDDSDPLRREAAKQRAKSEKSLRERFARAIAEGDLPADADAAALAKYVATVAHGMSVQAAGGASRAELDRVVELALAGLPGRPARSRRPRD
ncbi:MAG: TetR/AcrR family transcriptional regulator [Pirellulales bacterium]